LLWPGSDPAVTGSDAAERLARYDARMRVPIVLSAILPLIIAPQVGHPVSVAIGIATWLVFAVDLVVRRRLVPAYLSTWAGRFDLAVVVLTAPWFLLPGAEAGAFVVVLRLARLARLVQASRASKQLVARLGRVAVVAGSIMLVCALVALVAERPTNDEFASYADSLWWSVVTLTTVGYGDIAPITTTGRLAAAVLMVTGIAVLGLLAGSLASFLGLEQDQPSAEPEPASPPVDELVAEVRALRVAVERLQSDRTST
jgi:voltage-gated potassium channel